MKTRCFILVRIMMMVVSFPICADLFAIIGMNPGYAFALEPDKELEKIRVGDISVFTGEVLIRVNGRWSQLKKMPQPLYSSDKVVTRRGRAEIRFVDGGILRLDIDTNISISQDIKRTKTLFSEKVVTSRQVNLLVGKLWFDVKTKEKESSLKFKTPLMTSLIQGASGKIGVKTDGSTDFGIAAGNSENKGVYTFINNPKDMTSSDIAADVKNLPESDPEVDNSDMQKLARQSVSREEAGRRAKEDADKRVKNTKKKNDPAALALAAAAKADAEAAKTNAAILSAEEVLEEAKRMENEDAIAKAEDVLDGIITLADNADNAAQQSAKMASEALSATTPEEKEAYAAAALAYGSAAEANGNAVSSAVNVAEIAVSDYDEAGVVSAQGEVEKSKKQANQATIAAKNASIITGTIKNADSEESRHALSAAALASASAASASASAARANAVVAEVLSVKSIKLVIQTQESAAKAEDNAREANRFALISFEHAKKTADATTNEERDANVAAARANSFAAKANESAAKANESAAKANAKVSDELLSGDERSLAKAKEEAKNKDAMASGAGRAAKEATIAADAGNVREAEKAAADAAVYAAATETGKPSLLKRTENIFVDKEPPVNDREPASPY